MQRDTYIDSNWQLTGNPRTDTARFDELMARAREAALKPSSAGNPAATYVLYSVDGLPGHFAGFKTVQENYDRVLVAAQGGYAPAEMAVAEHLNAYKPHSEKEQIQWLTRAALQGYGPAMFTLGHIYRNMHDDRLGRAWMQQAAELNVFRAAQDLCSYYHVRAGDYPDAAYTEVCGGTAGPGGPSFEERLASDPTAQVVGGILAFSVVAGLLGPKNANVRPDGSQEIYRENARRMDEMSNRSLACFWYGQTGDPLMRGMGGGLC